MQSFSKEILFSWTGLTDIILYMCSQGTITAINKTKTIKEINQSIVRELSFDRINADI